MRALDHLAVTAGTLAAGVAHVEAALGVPLDPGGRHDHMATHNRLLRLGPGEYLEVIAPDPDAPRPDWPRWFRLDERDGRPRLTNWVVRVGDLDAALAAAPAGAGRPVDLARGGYRWRMGVPADGKLPFDDAHPAFIEWRGPMPQDQLPDRGCRLVRLEIAHPDADRLMAAVGLDDPRLVFTAGPAVLRATIATPRGPRVLD